MARTALSTRRGPDSCGKDLRACSAAGARSYTAPVESPFAHAAPVFVSLLFFALTQEQTLGDAVGAVTAFDRELARWKFFDFATDA